MSDGLDKLEILTNNLPSLVKEESEGYVEYKVGKGTSLGFNLYNNGDIAIQRAFLTKGTTFPTHVHENEIEILIIYKGSGKLITIKEEKIFKSGETCRVEKGVPHSWEMLEDSWLIGITIPAGEGYPDGKT